MLQNYEIKNINRKNYNGSKEYEEVNIDEVGGRDIQNFSSATLI